ncbi:MAG: VWA domain-containing protein [Gammaproteobacteria bacterium]|nr:VWA domain-containing protein [Gammaproteobacteria bacterium]
MHAPFRYLLLILFLLVSVHAHAMEKPLLMDGKKTLFQRVLSIPDSRLYAEPDAQSSAEEIIPFSVFYVYQRKADWLQVGNDSFGKIIGWIPQRQTIVWNQALTVSFKDPQDTQRVLMFRDRQALQKLVSDNDQEAYASLYQKVVSDEVIKNNPVVAIQPEGHIDIRNNFYLVPIKQHLDVYLGNEQARLLEIASVPLESGQKVAPPAPASNPADSVVSEQRPRQYRSGIHFVIDSTVSMGPYIDRTREAVRKVYGSIARQGLNNQVNFGLTAFRDNIELVPELDYLTRTFVNLEQGADSSEFFSRVNTLEPSSVSSRDYREDAYAGIKAAIDNSNWNDFDARYVVLITDAGPRESDDVYGKTRLSATALRQLAYDKGISIWVLHLRSDSPVANHERAEALYKKLSYYPGIGDFYYGVELGKVDEFGNVLEVLANQITQQVMATINGVLPIPIPDQPEPQKVVTAAPKTEAPKSQLAQLQTRVARLGNALRLRYLQKEAGEPIPKVFNAWMVDRDFSNPQKSLVDIRVLLTRDQLSDLKSVMQQVLDLAEEGVLTPSGFLNDLKSLAASVSRDPSSVASNISSEGGNLADLGYMREYIDDLPYTGEVMNLSLASWEEWSAKEQIEFMHRLEGKINYYQALHDHTDLWVTPGGGSVNGNSMFPVVLDLLP